MCSKKIDDILGQNFLDTREIDELLEDLIIEIECLEAEEDQAEQEEIAQLKQTLEKWEAFRDKLYCCCEWQHGETLILDQRFEAYAQDLAEDIYKISNHWPFYHIDWEQAAKELQMDYTCADIDGCTYWVRSS